MTSKFVRMMRAISVEKFGGPKVLKVKEVAIPKATETKVLVKIFSSGVNPVDTYIREGAFAKLPELPYTPGKDGAGIVEAVGENVTAFKKGDRVFVCMLISSVKNHGTCGEYALAEEKDTFLLSGDLSFDEGAAIGIPYFTAYRALILKGHAEAKDCVLIHGASGAVGLACVQLAKARGCRVFGTAGTREGMELVKKHGADHVVSHKEAGYLEGILDFTNDNGVDIIVEMLANVNLGRDLRILSPRGRVMIVGCRGSVNINPRDMMMRESQIIGVGLASSSKEEWKQTADAILDGIKEGWVKPVIHKKYNLDECANAHEDIIKSKGAKGKFVITVSEIA